MIYVDDVFLETSFISNSQVYEFVVRFHEADNRWLSLHT